ncbi:MAG: IS4/IS5 family transposase, partial [Planctomycetaceae bacterium]
MFFTPGHGGADSGFELVRQSLLQDASLPFADALTAEHIQQAFDAEGVWFGESDGDASAGPEDNDGIVYTPAVTLWAMLSQALLTDKQRACVAAVQRVAVYYMLLGRIVSSTNT